VPDLYEVLAGYLLQGGAGAVDGDGDGSPQGAKGLSRRFAPCTTVVWLGAKMHRREVLDAEARVMVAPPCVKTVAVLHLLILLFVLLSCCFLSLFLTKISPPRLLVLRCVDQGGGHAARQDAERQQQAVRKPPLFAPFIYKMHLFTKTGSGQT
jgi:hypothetical protein